MEKKFNDFYFKPKAIEIFLNTVQEKTDISFLLDLSLDDMLLQLYIAKANLEQAIKMAESLRGEYR